MAIRSLCCLQIGGILQVQQHRSLVAIEGREEAGAGPVKGAGFVAVRGRFDLDDVGAEVGKDQAGSRSGNHVTELDDADTGKREMLICHRCSDVRGGSLA